MTSPVDPPLGTILASERGFDGGKKVFGRKRHLLTDTLGFLITAVVHSARLYAGVGAKQVFAMTKARGITLKIIAKPIAASTKPPR